jgi:hypothetical protein
MTSPRVAGSRIISEVASTPPSPRQASSCFSAAANSYQARPSKPRKRRRGSARSHQPIRPCASVSSLLEPALDRLQVLPSCVTRRTRAELSVGSVVVKDRRAWVAIP